MAHTDKLFLDKAGHIVVYEHERISVHGKDIADLCTFYPKIQDCSQIVPVCEFLAESAVQGRNPYRPERVSDFLWRKLFFP